MIERLEWLPIALIQKRGKAHTLSIYDVQRSKHETLSKTICQLKVIYIIIIHNSIKKYMIVIMQLLSEHG